MRPPYWRDTSWGYAILFSGFVHVYDHKFDFPANPPNVLIDAGSGDEVAEDLVVRDRRHLAEDGIVLPVLAINKLTGMVESPPEIISRGFVSLDDDGLLQRARDIVLKTLETSSDEEKSDYGVIKEKIRTDLKRFLKKETSKRPMVIPVILEI